MDALQHKECAKLTLYNAAIDLFNKSLTKNVKKKAVLSVIVSIHGHIDPGGSEALYDFVA